MIHNLFDEYKFFPQYPDKELQITGILFGSLIQNDLITLPHLQTALKCILDAVKKPPGTRMFNFGVIALQHFKYRLPLWPQYCSHLLSVDHLKRACPEVLETIILHLVLGKNSEEDPNNFKDPKIIPESLPEVIPKAEPVIVNPEPNLPLPEDKPVPFSLSARLSPPPSLPEATIDKIHFVINNLSENNIQKKLDDLKSVVSGQNEYAYITHYMVIKRITLEPNFHQLYIKFFTELNIPSLFEMLYQTCLAAAKILLASDSVLKDIGDRSQLKSLGTWIGLSTIARNKPILHKHLSLKVLSYFSNLHLTRRLIRALISCFYSGLAL